MNKMRTYTFSLIIGSLLSIVLFSTNRTSQNHDQRVSFLKSRKKSCASRSISSIEKKDQQLKSLCANQRNINSLTGDIEKLEKEEQRVLALVKKLKSDKKPNKKKKSDNKLKNSFQWSYLANNYSNIPFQKQTITWTQNPFNNFDPSKDKHYLTAWMSQRINLKLREPEAWSPNWNSNGHPTNLLYGNSQTWQELEGMYRNPQTTQYPSFSYY